MQKFHCNSLHKANFFSVPPQLQRTKSYLKEIIFIIKPKTMK